MDTLMNWLAFAALVYGLGAGAKKWPGPIVTTRHVIATRQQNRRSDMSDTPTEGEDDGVVSSPVDPEADERIEFAPGVWVSPDPRMRVIRRPTGPVPLEQLIDTGPDDENGGDAVPSLSAQVHERRRWVRARLDPNDPLHLSPVEIDRRGAELFECAERTIQRDRERLTRQRQRGPQRRTR